MKAILHCSPLVARCKSRSPKQLLHQVAASKQCHQNACIASISRPKCLEAVHVKEEQEMMKVILDIMAPNISTTRKLYTAIIHGRFMTGAQPARPESSDNRILMLIGVRLSN